MGKILTNCCKFVNIFPRKNFAPYGILYRNSDMILEVGYIISEFGYDIRLAKSCVTTSYGFLTQTAPHTYK